MVCILLIAHIAQRKAFYCCIANKWILWNFFTVFFFKCKKFCFKKIPIFRRMLMLQNETVRLGNDKIKVTCAILVRNFKSLSFPGKCLCNRCNLEAFANLKISVTSFHFFSIISLALGILHLFSLICEVPTFSLNLHISHHFPLEEWDLNRKLNPGLLYGSTQH